MLLSGQRRAPQLHGWSLLGWGLQGAPRRWVSVSVSARRRRSVCPGSAAPSTPFPIGICPSFSWGFQEPISNPATANDASMVPIWSTWQLPQQRGGLAASCVLEEAHRCPMQARLPLRRSITPQHSPPFPSSRPRGPAEAGGRAVRPSDEWARGPATGQQCSRVSTVPPRLWAVTSRGEPGEGREGALSLRALRTESGPQALGSAPQVLALGAPDQGQDPLDWLPHKRPSLRYKVTRRPTGYPGGAQPRVPEKALQEKKRKGGRDAQRGCGASGGLPFPGPWREAAAPSRTALSFIRWRRKKGYMQVYEEPAGGSARAHPAPPRISSFFGLFTIILLLFLKFSLILSIFLVESKAKTIQAAWCLP